MSPTPTQQERELRSRAFRLDSPTKDDATQDGTGLVLRFTPENWFVAQTVNVLADDVLQTDLAGAFTRPELGDSDQFSFDDDAVEGLRFAVINHTVTAEAAAPRPIRFGLTMLRHASDLLIDAEVLSSLGRRAEPAL